MPMSCSYIDGTNADGTRGTRSLGTQNDAGVPSPAYRSVSSIDAVTQALGMDFDPGDLLRRSISRASHLHYHLPRLF